MFTMTKMQIKYAMKREYLIILFYILKKRGQEFRFGYWVVWWWWCFFLSILLSSF